MRKASSETARRGRVSMLPSRSIVKVEIVRTMAVWIGTTISAQDLWLPTRYFRSRRMSDLPPFENALDLARARETPQFFVVDDNLQIVFHTAIDSPAGLSSLPAAAEKAVRGLMKDLAETHQASAVAIISPSQVVRVLRLEAEDGADRFAVLVERFAARSSVVKAAKRFGLSTRETEVLEGLMRGESTNAIAGRLSIAPTTVQEHIRKIGYKTNVTKRSAIVATVFGLQ